MDVSAAVTWGGTGALALLFLSRLQLYGHESYIHWQCVAQRQDGEACRGEQEHARTPTMQAAQAVGMTIPEGLAHHPLGHRESFLHADARL